MAQPIGWYPDPDHPGYQHWWDGQSWTMRRQTPEGEEDDLGQLDEPAATHSRTVMLASIGAVMVIVALVAAIILTSTQSTTPIAPTGIVPTAPTGATPMVFAPTTTAAPVTCEQDPQASHILITMYTGNSQTDYCSLHNSLSISLVNSRLEIGVGPPAHLALATAIRGSLLTVGHYRIGKQGFGLSLAAPIIQCVAKQGQVSITKLRRYRRQLREINLSFTIECATGTGLSGQLRYSAGT